MNMEMNNKVHETQPQTTQPYVTNHSAHSVRIQPNQIAQPNNWKRGLFSCCNAGVSWSLCKAFCCPCVLFGELAQQTGYGNCCACGVAYCVLFAPIAFAATFVGAMDFSCIVHRGLRKKIRELKGLPLKPWNDCFVTWFCGCCALAQEAYEMDTAVV